MKFEPQNHHRRSIRLKGYDYTQSGAYFVTLVTQGRQAVFGEVVNGQMCLNAAGKIVQREWESLPRRFPFIQLDAFVIMPNHIHAVIVIDHPAVGATHPCQPEIHSGQSHLPTHTPSGNDGSPHPTTNPPTVGATHPCQPEIHSGQSDTPTHAPSGNDGSPRQANDPRLPTGATHTRQPEIHSGQSHLPTYTPSGNDGSPHHRDDPRVAIGATRSGLIGVEPGQGELPDEVLVGHDGSPLRRDDQRRPIGPPPASLGAVIGQFKSRITKQVWRAPSWKGVSIWQRNYYEHIIRNEDEHQRITLYIEGNPECWPTDDENPAKAP